MSHSPEARKAWTAKVLHELEGLLEHYDRQRDYSFEQLLGAAKGGCKALLESRGEFTTHDALRLACCLVQLVREGQLIDMPEGPPRPS